MAGSKRFIHNGMDTIDSIMALMDHCGFKFIHDNRFPRQLNEKVFVFKTSIDLFGSGIKILKKAQIGGDMENTWIMFENVKSLYEWTIMACHVMSMTTHITKSSQ